MLHRPQLRWSTLQQSWRTRAKPSTMLPLIARTTTGIATTTARTITRSASAKAPTAMPAVATDLEVEVEAAAIRELRRAIWEEQSTCKASHYPTTTIYTDTDTPAPPIQTSVLALLPPRRRTRIPRALVKKKLMLKNAGRSAKSLS